MFQRSRVSEIPFARVEVEIPTCGGWSLSFSDSAVGEASCGGTVDHLGGFSSDRAG